MFDLVQYKPGEAIRCGCEEILKVRAVAKFNNGWDVVMVCENEDCNLSLTIAMRYPVKEKQED